MSVDSVALALVFDPEALESLTGAARAGHLRFKPSTGLTAALLDADGAPTGWLRVLADGEEKLDNARRRAERRSLTVEATALPERVACEERAARHDEGAPQPAQQANHSGAGTGDAAGALPGTITAFWGPVLADPGLAKVFDEIDDSLTDAWQILRYNPLRRLVVKATAPDGTPVAGRLTHDRQNHLREAAERIARQVPTVARLRDTGLPESSRITWWDWCDGGDLASSPSPEAAREAGRITAQLHQVTPPPVDGVRGTMGGQLEANVNLLTALDADLGARLRTATGRLLPRLYGGSPSVTCHGDLSADQFFLKGSRVRLGDLDRVTAGPPEFDLGSFAATSPALLDDFLTGYRSLSVSRPRRRAEPVVRNERVVEVHEDRDTTKGPRSIPSTPTPAELTAWTAYAHAIRVLEPFRQLAPDWRAQVAARIDAVEEALCNPS